MCGNSFDRSGTLRGIERHKQLFKLFRNPGAALKLTHTPEEPFVKRRVFPVQVIYAERDILTEAVKCKS